MSENYYITISDIIAIGKFYNIPLILFSNKNLTCFGGIHNSVVIDEVKEMGYLLLIGGRVCSKHPSRQVQPKYGILQYKGEIEINIEKMDSNLLEELKRKPEIKKFEDYSVFRKGKPFLTKPRLDD